DLRRKGELPRRAPEVERLDPEAVAGQVEAPPARVEECEREHPRQSDSQLARAEPLVAVNQHLRVAPPDEVVAVELEAGPEVAGVLDVAGVDTRAPSIPVVER